MVPDPPGVGGPWGRPGDEELGQVEERVTDLDGRERLALAPLVLLIIVLGLFPKPMLDVIEPVVQSTMLHVGVTDPEPRVSAEGGR